MNTSWLKHKFYKLTSAVSKTSGYQRKYLSDYNFFEYWNMYTGTYFLPYIF